MKVVIAEKPSVARDLARVMGAKEVKDGYISGNGYAFTYAFGHLVQLCTPQAYGFYSWSKSNLPIIPQAFKLESKRIRKNGKIIEDPGVLKQLNVIRTLIEQAEELIVATDAGREGELIFRNIYYYLGIEKPFKRLWISSQTDKAIRKGFETLKNGEEYDSLYFSARSRSESDWLIGMNATQAITLAAGNRGLLSLGRVQTPTLAMICSRYRENKDFKPQAFYRLQAAFEKDGIRFKALTDRIDSKEDAELLFETSSQVGQAKVIKVEEKEVKEPPPLLYDLTNLQQDANKQYGYSADETLNLAQSLYEMKLITYPRTGSRYIGKDVFEQIEELFTHLAATAEESIAALSAGLLGKTLTTRSVDDKKVTDHHALLVTDETPRTLSSSQRNLYNMIAKRMVESFSEYCIKAITTVTLSCKEVLFIAKGTVIKQSGWRFSLDSPAQEEDKKEEDESDQAQLPTLVEQELLPVLGIDLLERFTKAKPIHTEASLLKAMETSGKEIDDEEMRQAMKDCGLGTPATRAATIETLFQREYIKREKKRLIPTEKGLFLYELVKDRAIAKVELTGKWEQKLEEMRANKVSYEVFMKHIKDFTHRITKELLQLKIHLPKESTASKQTLSIACPKCKKGFVQLNEKIGQCTLYARGCDFRIWRTLFGVFLEEVEIKRLLEEGRSSKFDKLFDKNENRYRKGHLILKDLRIQIQESS